MYSLDINLLRERTESQTGQRSEFIDNMTMIPTAQYGKVPLFIGLGVAVLGILTAGGGWLLLNQQTERLEAKQRDLDQKLGSLKVQDARLQQLNVQLTQVTDETQSLASVFNQVQPWSAILQDLRESIPQGVQIAGVSQSEIKGVVPTATAPVAAPAPSGGLINKISTPPSPEANSTPAPTISPAVAVVPDPAGGAGAVIPSAVATVATLSADIPTTKIDITGTAKSFEEVNNFILTLKQSAFFNPDDTQLLSASLMPAVILTKTTPVGGGTPPTVNIPDGASAENQNSSDKLTRLELPKVVEYKIQTSLKRIPAADMIRELDRKGAVGLVTRLRSIQQQQVIKP